MFVLSWNSKPRAWLAACLVLAVTGCQEDKQHIAFQKALHKPHDLSLGMNEPEFLSAPIRPLPVISDLNPEKVKLGDKLFHEARLSRDDTISCASCHVISRGGDDGLAQSIGVSGSTGVLNSPTVLNATFNLAQFWDGRARDLEEQAAGPVHNPIEMASSWEQVVSKLSTDDLYKNSFSDLYADGMTGDNIANAIAEFERSLVTPSSFDRYLRGDERAISTEAKSGFASFKSYGCVSCHQGVNVGGNLYQRFGAVVSIYEKESISKEHEGRRAVTGDPEDDHVFKVPSLRNAARTAPYFHNGSASTLADAIRIMGMVQLGITIPDDDVAEIQAFLESLNSDGGA